MDRWHKKSVQFHSAKMAEKAAGRYPGGILTGYLKSLEYSLLGDLRPRDPRAPVRYCGHLFRTVRRTGRSCRQAAGAGTDHPGTGFCLSHERHREAVVWRAEAVLAELAAWVADARAQWQDADRLVREFEARAARLRVLMCSPPVPQPDKQIRQRTGRDDHLELGIPRRRVGREPVFPVTVVTEAERDWAACAPYDVPGLPDWAVPS